MVRRLMDEGIENRRAHCATKHQNIQVTQVKLGSDQGHAAAELSYLPLVSSKTLDWVALLDDKPGLVGWAPVDGF